MLLHTGDTPHRCDECGKSYVQAKSLLDHKRKHTGKSLYPVHIALVGK
jgi:uncharacterized Zn-finger protein